MLLCLTLIANAQENEIYKCGRAGVRSTIDDDPDGRWSEWRFQESSIMVRLFTKENKIEFNNEAGSVFYYDELLKETTGTDDDGDKWIMKVWSGYDEEGLKCNLRSIDYINLENRNFIMEYNNMQFAMECKILNKQTAKKNTNTVTPPVTGVGQIRM